MRFYFALKAPHIWARLDSKGKVLEQGVAAKLNEVPVVSKAQIIAVAPGSEIVCHKVTVPSRNRRKVIAALPYALEEIVSSDIENIHVVLLDWTPGSQAIAAIVERQTLDSWLQDCTTAGIRVDHLVPDYLLLPVHPQSRMTLARQYNDTVCIREEQNFGMTLDIDMLRYWWLELKNNALAIAVNDKEIARQLIELNGTQVSEWQIGDQFTDWLAHGGHMPAAADILQADYLPEHRRQRRGGFKAAAIIALLALAITTVMNAVELWYLQQQYEQKNEAITQLFKQVFPDSKRNLSFTHYMSKVKQVKSGGRAAGDFQFLLAAVARAIPGARSVVQELNFRDNVLIVTCVTRNFAELDKLRQHFASDNSIVVKLLSSGSRDDKTSGRFELRRVRTS